MRSAEFPEIPEAVTPWPIEIRAIIGFHDRCRIGTLFQTLQQCLVNDAKKFPAAWLSWFLKLVGIFTLLAFGAAVMPESWIVAITDSLGLDPFPDTPLAFYLARHLSLLYGFIGLALIVLSQQLERYRELVGYLAWAIVLFGVTQGLVDLQSGMPIWWTAGESLSTIFGGVLVHWLHRRCS